MTWDKPIISKELHFVYIVDGKKFLRKKDAELYVTNLEADAIYREGFIDA